MWLCCHVPSIFSGIEHYFAEEIGAFEQVMRCRSLVQRQALMNHWLHASQRHEANERLHILRAPRPTPMMLSARTKTCPKCNSTRWPAVTPQVTSRPYSLRLRKHACQTAAPTCSTMTSTP